MWSLLGELGKMVPTMPSPKVTNLLRATQLALESGFEPLSV